MHTMNRTFASIAVVALASLFQATAASAQLGNASARTLGLGGTTATAARFEAISVNPAGLGMPGSGFSLALMPGTFRSGLNPVTLKDLSDVAGQVVSSSVKEAWLADILAAGSQTGTAGGDLALVALTAGHFGFQVSVLGGGTIDLAPDVVEMLLYGNAGRSGSPADLAFSGSTADAYAVTTMGASFGLPIKTATGSMAVGATLKYSVGNGLIVGREQGGSIQSNPIKVDVDFPVVMSDDENYEANQGSGIGLDVGFQMQRDKLHFGASVQNLLNTFAWDDTKLVYRPVTATLEQGSNDTDFDKRPYASAPANLKSVVDGMTFDPAVSVGAAYDVQPDFTVSADVRNRFGDGMSLTPKLQAGAGAEYRGMRALHLRGGVAVITGGFQFGGGASLILGPVNLSFAGAMQKGDVDTNIGQFTLSFGGR